MQSNSEKRPIVGWWEEDAYTTWRKVLHWKPGVLKFIKRTTHKRDRRRVQNEIRKELKE